MNFKQEVIDKLKKEHKNLFLYSTEDKKYSALFRGPNRSEFGIFQQMTQSNPLGALATLCESLFLEGDRELLTEDQYFYGLSAWITQTIDIKAGEIKKL